MQPYKQGISCDGYSQTNQRSELTDAALLTEELIKIYSTPTPKGWREPKSKGTNLCLLLEMFITKARVQYLYPRPDYESWSNRTSYKLGKENQSFLIWDNWDSNLSLLWSLTCLLILCLAEPVDWAHSLDVVISLADQAIYLADLIGGLGLPW